MLSLSQRLDRFKSSVRRDKWIASNTKTVTSAFKISKHTVVKTYINNTLHSINDEPAVIYYYPDKQVERRVWYKNGQLHRNYHDTPAVIEYLSNGNMARSLELLHLALQIRHLARACISYYM